jgi:hypothetical protein
MEFDAYKDQFVDFVYADVERAIWIFFAIMLLIVVAGSIYSTGFRRFVAITIVLSALALWALKTYVLNGGA